MDKKKIINLVVKILIVLVAAGIVVGSIFWVTKGAEAAGTPTSGDGYCKLPDGTLICYGRISSPPTAPGENSTIMVTFPQSFSSRPVVTVSPVREAVQTPYLFPVSVYLVSASEVTFAFSNRYDVATSLHADWIAIGRWK